MSYLNTKLLWAGTELTNYYGLTVKRGKEAKSSTIAFKLKNSHKEWVDTASADKSQIKIKQDDELKVYAVWDTPVDVADKTHLLMIANVTEISTDFNSKKQMISIIAVDKTAQLLDKAWSYWYPSADSPTHIQAVIDSAINDTIKDATKKIGWHPDNPAAKSDGNPFSSNEFGMVFKPVYEWVQSLSATEMTGDNRAYLYYVDVDESATPVYRLRWFYPYDPYLTTLSAGVNSLVTTIPVVSTADFTSEGVFSIGNETIYYANKDALNFLNCKRGYSNTAAASHSLGDNATQAIQIDTSPNTKFKVYSMKLKFNADEGINMIIFRGGYDLRQNPILWYKYDLTNKLGKLRIKVMDWQRLSETERQKLYGQNRAVNPAFNTKLTNDITAAAVNITLDDVTNYVNYTPNGFVQIGQGDQIEYVKYDNVVGNQLQNCTRGAWRYPAREHKADDFVREVTQLVAKNNDDFRTEVKVAGKREADTWMTGLGAARWKGTIVTKGTVVLPGEMIFLVSPEMGFNYLPLRLDDVTHNLSNGNWVTTLEVKEDELSK